MARTSITNTASAPLPLPLPYGVILPAGGQAIVADSVATVLTNLGGAARVQSVGLVVSQSGSSADPLTSLPGQAGFVAMISAGGAPSDGSVIAYDAATGTAVWGVPGGVTFPIDVAHGGTNADNAASARANLNVPPIGDVNSSGAVVAIQGIPMASGTPNAGDFKVFDGTTFQNAPLTSFVGTSIQFLGTANSAGSGGNYARDNHVHALGTGAMRFKLVAGQNLSANQYMDVAGLKVGDQVLFAAALSNISVQGGSWFETVVTQNDKLKQLQTGNLTSTYVQVITTTAGG